MFHIKMFTFSPIEENTFVLWNEDRQAIIIDPGCYHDYEKDELKDFIDENSLTVKWLLNTHCHLDHVFGEKFVADTWLLIPYIHPNEQQMMRLAEASGKMWGMPFTNYEGPVHSLEAGGVIELGQDSLQCLFTPGHSPGHICFYCAKQGFVIGGDALFAGSIGRTDLPLGNHDTLVESIKNQLLSLPEETVVYPGHGPSTTIGKEKKTNPFLV